MIRLVFNHDWRALPVAANDVIPVQLYGIDGLKRGDISVIGNPIPDKIQRLGVQVSEQSMDFLTIALAVTASDTFVHRDGMPDGWTREMHLEIPLCDADRWNPVKEKLEKALQFLSGDIWHLDFTPDGYQPPSPRGGRYKLVNLRGLDCVSLFSGGLDSAIGAIDLFSDGLHPLLVSHAYPKDYGKQKSVKSVFGNRFSSFELNANPSFALGSNDISMRSRSINFLAFAAVGANAVQQVNQLEKVDLYVPENGFISLNVPLTPRRIGTLSTKTTHPYFIKSIQEIFDTVGIGCNIINPYQFKTKGQMVVECQDQQQLRRIVADTVSCSHWKRRNIQCGVCVPCIIRKASLHAGNLAENVQYENTLLDVMRHEDKRDDLMALQIALNRRATKNISTWVLNSGPLPNDLRSNYEDVFLQGLNEIEQYITSELPP